MIVDLHACVDAMSSTKSEHRDSTAEAREPLLAESVRPDVPGATRQEDIPDE